MGPGDGDAKREPRFQRLLLSYLLRYKWRYLAGFGSLIRGVARGDAAAGSLAHDIDDIAEGATISRLAALGGVIIGGAIVENLLRSGARHLVSGTSRRVNYDLRKVIVHHQGRVAEVGTHDELLSRRGLYYRLYELQYKDQDLVDAAR